MYRTNIICPAVMTGLLASHGSVAGAQVLAGNGDAASSATELQEIVVTAEKRAESSQKTPISMEVLTSEQLSREDVHDITTLSSIAPSVNFVAAEGHGYVAMRGVASQDVSEIGDPAVVIARDGFFANRAFTLFSSFYDLGRVEVLNGPQGTLYGRNAAGGVINIITNRPTKDYSGYASAESGDYDTRNFELAQNIPILDWLQMRVSGVSRFHQGYVNNGAITLGPVSVQQRGDDEDAASERVQLSAQFTDQLNGWVSFQHDDQSGVGDVIADGPYGVVYKVPDPQNFSQLVPTSVSLYENRYRWEFNYSPLPADVSLTYLGGYDTTRWRKVSNLLDGILGPGGPLFQAEEREQPDTVNHEIRLASAGISPLFWQVGFFYFKEDNNLYTAANGASPPFANTFIQNFIYRVLTQSKAGFGQLSYQINDTVKLSAGARYTDEGKMRTGVNNLNAGPLGGPPGLLATNGFGSVDEKKTTWHAGIDWIPYEDTLVYGKVDTGFKAGGFSLPCGRVETYSPETVTAFELGTKNWLAAKHVQLNVALFDQEYTGYQASSLIAASPTCPAGSSEVVNAGKARIYGLETNLSVIDGAIGKIDLNLTYLHTKFVDFNVLNAAGEPTSYAGNALPVAPKLSASLGVEHTWHAPLGAITARVDGRYEGSKNYSYQNFPDNEVSAETTLNAFLIYAWKEDRWNVELYGKNLTNETVYLNAARGEGSYNNYEFGAPRTYGVKLTSHW